MLESLDRRSAIGEISRDQASCLCELDIRFLDSVGF